MAAPLPVGKVLMGAFLVPWWHRKAFFRALAIPVMLLVAFSLSWYYAGAELPSWIPWLLCLVYAAFFTLFAVTCHRLVLLDAEQVAKRPELRWSRRESLFLGWVVGAWIACMLTSVAVAMLLAMAFGAFATKPPPADTWRSLQYLGWVAAFYLIGRISLVFPATAVDRRLDFKGSWQLTRNNGWRLFIIVGLLPWALSYLVNLAYRSDPTPPEVLLLSIVGTAVFTFEVAALSIAYRELTKDA